MRICFIRLPMTWAENQFADPPLGLLYTATATKEAGHNVKFWDMSWNKNMPKADVYGISATTLDYPEACRVAKKIRNQEKDAIIILGGIHATVLPESVDQELFDICYIGEGEDLPKLLNLLKHGHKIRKFTASRQKNLDELNFPLRELLRPDLYFHSNTVFRGNDVINGKSGTIITSRGCPFNCAFCASPSVWGKKVYWRTSDNVIKEIDSMTETYGVKQLRFQDDNLTLNKKFLTALCNQLAEREIYWRCSTRVNLVDDKMLDTLWKGGCREIGLGIESADDGVLSLVNKGMTVKDQLRGALLLRDHGFRIRIFLMTGLPGETPKTADKTIEFLTKVSPDVVTLNTFMPIPGCDIYSNPNRYEGEIIKQQFENIDFTLKWDKAVPFGYKSKHLTLDEMEKNREKLKAFIFNRKLSNAFSLNKPYS